MGMTDRHEKTLTDMAEAMSYGGAVPGMCHFRRSGEPLPSQDAVKRMVGLCRSIIFPGFFGESDVSRYNVRYHAGLWIEELYEVLVDQITAGLCAVADCCAAPDIHAIAADAGERAVKFVSSLPELRRVLMTDVRATFLGDPAAASTEEVIYCYPGIRAMINHRIAHELVKLDVPVIPRMISEQAHGETGIDIHPAATIGEAFTIDHGTGVVIGATSVIGRNVKIYQGVTLGAKSFDLDADGNPIKGIPRHPVIGDNVVIYSNSTILGRISVGDGAVIGGNLWVTGDVAPGEKLVQAKANNILRFQQ